MMICNEQLFNKLSKTFFSCRRISFSKLPWLLFFNMSINILNHTPSLIDGISKFKAFHKLDIITCKFQTKFKLFYGIFLAKNGKPLDKITIIVCEFITIGIFKFLPGKICIKKSINMSGEEVAKSINTMPIQDLNWVDTIAQALADFLTINKNKAVGQNSARQRQAKPQKNCWPKNGVKTQNVFTYHLNSSWPIIRDILIWIP